MSGDTGSSCRRSSRDVPGQDEAATRSWPGRSARPHHAYLFTGPEGSGKRLGMRAFAAALLCPDGGCGECRDCRLALGERHPNMLVLEPTGPDILVGKDASDPNTARWFAPAAYLHPAGARPQGHGRAPGRPAAHRGGRRPAQGPGGAARDTVFILLSARPDRPPRHHSLAVPGDRRSRRCPRRSSWRRSCARAWTSSGRSWRPAGGGNLGRARRLARDESGAGVPRRRARRAAEQARGDRRARWPRPRGCWRRRRTSGRGLGEDAGGGAPAVPGRARTARGAHSGPWCDGWRSSTSAGCAAPSASSWTGRCWRCAAAGATRSSGRRGPRTLLINLDLPERAAARRWAIRRGRPRPWGRSRRPGPGPGGRDQPQRPAGPGADVPASGGDGSRFVKALATWVEVAPEAADTMAGQAGVAQLAERRTRNA